MKKNIFTLIFAILVLGLITGCNKNTLDVSDVKETLEARYNVVIDSIEENETYEDYSNLVSSYKIITNDGKEFYAGVEKITIGGFEPNEYEVIDNFQFIELRKVIGNKYNNLYWENYYLYKEIESNDISALSWNLHIRLNNENEINSIFIEYQDIINTINDLNLKNYSLLGGSIIFYCDGNKGQTKSYGNGKEYFSQQFYTYYLDEANELTLEQLKTEYYSFCK